MFILRPLNVDSAGHSRGDFLLILLWYKFGPDFRYKVTPDELYLYSGGGRWDDCEGTGEVGATEDIFANESGGRAAKSREIPEEIVEGAREGMSLEPPIFLNDSHPSVVQRHRRRSLRTGDGGNNKSDQNSEEQQSQSFSLELFKVIPMDAPRSQSQAAEAEGVGEVTATLSVAVESAEEGSSVRAVGGQEEG